MLSAIQACAIGPYRIEQQCTLGAILHRVRNYRNRVARLIRRLAPTFFNHDVDARSLDIPRSDSRGIFRTSPNRNDDVAVWVPPLIFFYDARIRNIFGYIEHGAGMMSKRR